MKVYKYTGTANSETVPFTNVGSPLLKGKNVITVVRDGIGLSKIRTFGIPGAKDAVFLTISGYVLVDSNVEPGGQVLILYQDL